MAEDIVYIPKTRSEFRPNEPSAWQEALETSPIYVNFNICKYLLLGWWSYLFTNMSGGSKYPEQTNHFLPSSPLFEEKHKFQILLSDAGIVVMLGVIGALTYQTDIWTVSKYYGVPYLLVNGWIVCITLLHHTDVYLPHYSPQAWNYVRGALTTVDRDFGWFLNHALLHIQDSHVCHHLFSQMPHYNAIKATPYLKEKLGEYYFYDQTPIWKSLYRATKDCLFVEDSGDVLFYKNK